MATVHVTGVRATKINRIPIVGVERLVRQLQIAESRAEKLLSAARLLHSGHPVGIDELPLVGRAVHGVDENLCELIVAHCLAFGGVGILMKDAVVLVVGRLTWAVSIPLCVRHVIFEFQLKVVRLPPCIVKHERTAALPVIRGQIVVRTLYKSL